MPLLRKPLLVFLIKSLQFIEKPLFFFDRRESQECQREAIAEEVYLAVSCSLKSFAIKFQHNINMLLWLVLNSV